MKPGGQREKGKAFERKVAAMIRAKWPKALVRRASQAERAHNPDVFVEGGPRILQRLWLELQDAAHPTPHAKLEQAVRDVACDPRRRALASDDYRIPVAVTHKRGAREILVTMNVGDLMNIVDVDGHHFEPNGEATIDFTRWLWFVARKGQMEDAVSKRPPSLKTNAAGSRWADVVAPGTSLLAGWLDAGGV